VYSLKTISFTYWDICYTSSVLSDSVRSQRGALGLGVLENRAAANPNVHVVMTTVLS